VLFITVLYITVLYITVMKSKSNILRSYVK